MTATAAWERTPARFSQSVQQSPVERIWLLLRERFLSHRLLNSNAAIVAVVVNLTTPSAACGSQVIPIDDAARAASALPELVGSPCQKLGL